MISRIRKSLVLKTTLLFFLAIIPPYLLVSILYLNYAKKGLYQEIVKGVKVETELMRDNLDARLFLLRSNARAWAGLEVMKDILTDDVDKRIASVLEGLKRDYGLSGDIYAINVKGKIVASSNPLSIGSNVIAPWLTDALAGRIVEIDAHTSQIDGSKVISFGIPVRPPFVGTKTIGVLLLEYHLKDLKDIAFTGGMPFVAIIDTMGEALVASSGEPILKTGVFELPRAKGEGLISPPGYIGAFARSRAYFDFKGFGWTIIGAVKEEVALSPVRKVERVSMVVGLMGVVLILFLVSIFANRTVRPLRKLSEMADYIARTKDLSPRFRFSSQDEVGRLADAFNNMVEEVRGYITRISEMEEEVRRADRLSALGELSAGMAHEIKNPLGIIKSSADILKKRPGINSQDRLLASIVSEESGRLEGILDAFLQFARPRPPQIGECQVNKVIERSLKLLEPEIKKSHINLQREFGESIPVIEADENQLHQVFVNLLINAIQAMPDGGSLTIKTGVISSSSITDRENDINMVEISFIDTGSGIQQEDREKIFNPFFTTKEKGSGLGLTIAHRIIEAHGGSIKVEENMPVGTLIRIRLPASFGKDHE